MTLNQLISQDGVEFHKKGNSIKIKEITQTQALYLEFLKYENGGVSVSQSDFPIPEKKKDLKTIIKKLKKKVRNRSKSLICWGFLNLMYPNY